MATVAHQSLRGEERTILNVQPVEEVSESQDDWERNQGSLHDISFLTGRVFEYTDEAIQQLFTSINGTDFDAMAKLPVFSPTKAATSPGPSAELVK